jgi:hypothetical protein
MRRGRTTIAVFVVMCLMVPALAMTVRADEIPSFDRDRTYKFYDATAGDDSDWTLFTNGAHSVSEKSVSAYSYCPLTGSIGAKGWGRVWKSVNCAESGIYDARMKGWYGGHVAVVGLATADLQFIFQVIDLDSNEVIREDMFAVLSWAIAGGESRAEDFVAFCTTFYAYATHHYAFALYVEAVTYGLPEYGYSEAVAWGGPAEYAYYDEISISPGSDEPWYPGCLQEGTEITMADGSVLPIEDVKKGMSILGYDLETSSLVEEEVVYTEKTKCDTMVSINQGLLLATRIDHPMYVRNGTWQGWVADPQDLRTGMELYCPLNDSWIKINTLSYVLENVKVYQIGLSAPDNYIANGILCDRKPIKG